MGGWVRSGFITAHIFWFFCTLNAIPVRLAFVASIFVDRKYCFQSCTISRLKREIMIKIIWSWLVFIWHFYSQSRHFFKKRCITFLSLIWDSAALPEQIKDWIKWSISSITDFNLKYVQIISPGSLWRRHFKLRLRMRCSERTRRFGTVAY